MIPARTMLIALLLQPLMGSAASLRVDLAPVFEGAPLAFDSLRFETGEGQAVSVTRLDFLLSGVALRRADGTWLGLRDWQAFLGLRSGRSSFTLRGLPEGGYTAMRLRVGLPPELNRSDPSKYPPGHPLHPSVNGLHWGWQGGYVFFALEGGWRMGDGGLGGYSFHLATDERLTTVELPMALDLRRDTVLGLELDVARVLEGVKLAEGAASTHSRAGDELADLLSRNLARTFAITIVQTPLAPAASGPAVREVVMAPGATLLPFAYPASYPRPALPGDNPLTREGVDLGRRLFAEPMLSVNNTQSCASCHRERAGLSDVARFSRGAEGVLGTRHAMPLANLAWKREFFWDGRARSLREQVLMPVQNEIEMHESLPRVVAKLGRSGEYPPLFARAFGTPEITADRIARALEQHLLTLLPARSRFDLAMEGKAALTAEEKRGFELFNTEYDPRRGLLGADCFHCHGGPLFTNGGFANNGLDAVFRDAGRYAVTRNEADRGKFAVPGLRDAALRTHYMHDGRFTTLEQVVDHYAGGVKRSVTLDPNLAKHPDGGVVLGASDRRALVAFLRTLTGEPSAPITSQSSSTGSSSRRRAPSR